MQYQISIEELQVKAVIGILDFERTSVQSILINCDIVYDKIDKNYINYAEVATLIEKMLQEKKYGLLEDALDEISTAIIEGFIGIKSVALKLSKPEILDNCRVSVELFRKI
ncbi:MAG: dihydroneopterin aldolase [Epsilonproteobacteria bacterium]|nr:dihydroneopterin aldolase [Campylobacterota bacterium]